ncbi:hypothetical protein EVAR_65934_1 [Eumeta japonica]|uniref:Uncharacterized protein n=1 Tax=Eumeta variegata TaxID=151549 RepID=A0A4C2AFH2_EUMVA|nr:hypothetical protein EVAR_65934_1 [Eumeta japonica]
MNKFRKNIVTGQTDIKADTVAGSGMMAEESGPIRAAPRARPARDRRATRGPAGRDVGAAARRCDRFMKIRTELRQECVGEERGRGHARQCESSQLCRISQKYRDRCTGKSDCYNVVAVQERAPWTSTA